jgi:diguanylate cyclase (GGDEF)-like protein/PAS domain S-box-containing protein
MHSGGMELNLNDIIFNSMFKDINIPVIVCEDGDEMNVSFANREAYLLLNPSIILEKPDADSSQKVPLRQLMRFQIEREQDNIRQTLEHAGSLSQYSLKLKSPEERVISVKIAANIACLGESKYIIIYVFYDESDSDLSREYNDILAYVLNTSYHSTDINQAVQMILSRVGEYIDVSRVYIFEDLLNDYTRNTYEWCAPGVEPAIQDLQNLCKDDYSYDIIVNPSGLYVSDDVSTLTEKDRAILEPQGIKALAILPLFQHDTPIGFIGYDDCMKTRCWSYRELMFLKGVGSVISSLIIRRNEETEIIRSYEVLQTISDNIDSVIYVNDLETFELKFVNRTLTEQLGVESDEVLGRKCWEVLQKGMNGPCPFCSIPKLKGSGYAPNKGVLEYEHQNTINSNWYWVKDSVIRWVDGTLAHFEVAIDITLRKKYEEQLHYYASTDALTGISNREWGIKVLQKTHGALQMTKPAMSLCFIDLDGLKPINDIFGHAAGDEAINRVARAISRRIRKDDMVCRWGGDEFLVLLGCDVMDADAVICHIQDDLKAKTEEGTGPTLSFSYGIVDFTMFDSVDAAIAAADGFMYYNKNSKR